MAAEWEDYHETWQDDWRSDSEDEDTPLRELYPKLLAPEYAISMEDLRKERKREVQKAMATAREQARQRAGTLTAEERTEEEKEWARKNRNRNTAATYESGWRQFAKWAEEMENPIRRAEERVDLERPSDSDVAAYARFIIQVKKGTMGSLAVALASISDRIRYSISPTYDPCNSTLVKQTRGALAPAARPAVQKLELGWEKLEHVLAETTKAPSRNNRRDALMFMLAYCSLLRTSEIARMDRKDVKITTEEIEGKGIQVLHIYVNPLAKNDTERKGHTRVVAEKTPLAMFCLVRMMRDFIEKDWTTGAEGALFQGDKGKRLSPDTPRGRLHHWLAMVKEIDPSAYGFHSLRAGGATDAAQAGVHARDIQLHGNWKSLAVLLYIRPQLANRLTVGRALGEREKPHTAAASSQPITILD